MSGGSFTQTARDGWTSGPHFWSPKSSAIIARNLTRTDMPEGHEVVRVTVTNEDGSRVTYRRRV